MQESRKLLVKPVPQSTLTSACPHPNHGVGSGWRCNGTDRSPRGEFDSAISGTMDRQSGRQWDRMSQIGLFWVQVLRNCVLILGRSNSFVDNGIIRLAFRFESVMRLLPFCSFTFPLLLQKS